MPTFPDRRPIAQRLILAIAERDAARLAGPGERIIAAMKAIDDLLDQYPQTEDAKCL